MNILSSEKITPSVLIDGRTVPVEGWMITLAFALRGIPWAVKEALNPAFDLRGKIQDYQRRKTKAYLEREIEYYETELNKMKTQLTKF